MKNRYLVFLIFCYEPLGGLSDCYGGAETIGGAMRIIERNMRDMTAIDVYVYDRLEDRKIVFLD